MLTGQQQHADSIDTAKLAHHQLFLLTILSAEQVQIHGTAIATGGGIINLALSASFLTVPALCLNLLKVIVEGRDHVLAASGLLLPSTSFYSQLLHLLFKLHVLSVYCLELDFFLPEFLKNLIFQ